MALSSGVLQQPRWWLLQNPVQLVLAVEIAVSKGAYVSWSGLNGPFKLVQTVDPTNPGVLQQLRSQAKRAPFNKRSLLVAACSGAHARAGGAGSSRCALRRQWFMPLSEACATTRISYLAHHGYGHVEVIHLTFDLFKDATVELQLLS